MKFQNLPLHYFNETSLIRLGSLLGTVLGIHPSTLALTQQSYCIEMDVSKPFQAYDRALSQVQGKSVVNEAADKEVNVAKRNHYREKTQWVAKTSNGNTRSQPRKTSL